MTTFVDRQKELFKQLRAAEKQAFPASKHERSNRERLVVQNRRNARQTRAEMKKFRGRESIFKRPEAPLSDCLPPRVVPGYLKNPNKWTCYNLENVPDVSERSNAEALAKCRQDILLDSQFQDISDIDSNDSDSKIVYKPPILNSEDGCKPKAVEYKNSIVIYPEHIVGQKSKSNRMKKEIQSKVINKNATRQFLKLDHLEEDDED